MGFRGLISVIFTFFLIAALATYFLIPIENGEFKIKKISDENSNFTLNSELNNSMQFYPNMRFLEKEISYKINKESCTLQKIENMGTAFDTISNLTILKFYETQTDEQITISCDSRNKFDGGLFVAGEGGPTKIINIGPYNTILNGKILLIKNSECQRPNVEIHEVLHVLGFDHSNNSNNIMYPVSKCDQTIGDDTLDLINELYSIPNQPDLLIENANATINGRYLNLEISVANKGLAKSQATNLTIYSKNKIIKEIELNSIEIGYINKMSLENIFIKEINIQELEIKINSDFEELNKNNNQVILEIIKN